MASTLHDCKLSQTDSLHFGNKGGVGYGTKVKGYRRWMVVYICYISLFSRAVHSVYQALNVNMYRVLGSFCVSQVADVGKIVIVNEKVRRIHRFIPLGINRLVFFHGGPL